MQQWTEKIPGFGALTERETGAFLLISTVVGVAVGLGAAGLIWAIEWVSQGVDWLVEEWAGTPLVWLAVIPVLLTVSWAISARFAPHTMGSGIAESIEALALHGGRIRFLTWPVKLVTSAITIGGGGSGGREGPVVQIGASLGSSIARRFGLGEDMVRSLVAAGAGAGIGASFHAPIAGMLFALEVILGTLSVRHLSSVVLASVAAAVTASAIVGEDEILTARPYELGDPRELLLYMGLAILVIAVAIPFLRLIERADILGERLKGPSRPLTLGLVTAGIAVVELTFNDSGASGVLRSGQDLLAQFINADSTFVLAWWAVALIAVMKMVASASTHASGGSAGLFMPSLVVGGAIGVSFGGAFDSIWTFSDLQPGAFAVVGMATMFAAVARAPLTSILIVFEITGTRNYGLILPLMLSATLATFLADRFHPLSLYTGALARKGINLSKQGEVDILDTIPIGDVMTGSPMRVRDTTPVLTIRDELDKRRSHGAPVIDQDGRLVGIITMTDIAKASADAKAADVMTPRPVTVTPTTPVSEALERMAALGVGRLPVVDTEDPTRLVGLFRREDAVSAYHRALGSSTGDEMHRSRLRLRTDPGARYYEFRIPPGSFPDRRVVKEVTWPEGSTLVSVRRGTLVLVPTGTTELLAGDVVTVFGTEGSERRLRERLTAAAEDPTVEVTIEMSALGDPPDPDGP